MLVDVVSPVLVSNFRERGAGDLGKEIYSHSPARVTPPLIVTPGLLSLPQICTSICSTAMMFDITQTLSVYNSEQ